jgi:threonine dehydrogenase-like Zn-dependent dehydrogenase
VPGVYEGFLIDKMPFGAAMNKVLTIKTGQTRVQRYGKLLLEKIETGQIDRSSIITHRLPLEEAPARLQDFP